MKASEIRDKYIKFFKDRGHRQIKPSPLVLEDDPTTLFTSAGMQPLVPYLKGRPHPKGKRLVNSQPSIRLQDIDKVGDTSHTTFFEMLGNWSLGDYFKEEQLVWLWEFLTQELGLAEEKLHITVFAGTKNVPRDEESYKIWRKIGVDDSHLHWESGNWWSRSGMPDEMTPGDIGGPDSEVFYDFGNPSDGGKFDTENPRYLEIGNSVFIEYEKQEDGSLKGLPLKNVDFGGGLERLTAAKNDMNDVFGIDIFLPVIQKLESVCETKYEQQPESYRIIADHLRAAVVLIAEGIVPSNKLQGYALRRFIRRSVFHQKLLKISKTEKNSDIAKSFTQIYPDLEKNWRKISQVLDEESLKFEKALSRGTKKLEEAIDKKQKIDGKFAFDLYQTEGFPFELTLEILESKGLGFTQRQKHIFEREFSKHQDSSRTASAGMFKGGLADTSEKTVRLHTAAHLLQAALRKVLGSHVRQKGQNITSERLRFDFSHPEKLTEDQIKKVEELVNEKIEEDLPVSFEEKTLAQAKKEGALAFFKYSDKVKVYTIGDPSGKWFSKEVCGGPHVNNTGKIGRVTITKEEAAGSGVRRIYAQLRSD